jgi:hypothetical protein
MVNGTRLATAHLRVDRVRVLASTPKISGLVIPQCHTEVERWVHPLRTLWVRKARKTVRPRGIGTELMPSRGVDGFIVLPWISQLRRVCWLAARWGICADDDIRLRLRCHQSRRGLKHLVGCWPGHRFPAQTGAPINSVTLCGVIAAGHFASVHHNYSILRGNAPYDEVSKLVTYSCTSSASCWALWPHRLQMSRAWCCQVVPPQRAQHPAERTGAGSARPASTR